MPATRPRDLWLERHLSALAAQGAGHTRALPDGTVSGDTLGLDAFADHRAHPGGVRLTLDVDREAAEELGDARNYLLWGIQPVYDQAVRGDADATEKYERYLRALSHVIAAWHALHTSAH